MVAYSYKGRFVAPIRVGLGLPVFDLHYELGGYLPGQPILPKRQTIRANGRRRHARPGETLQHYRGMRTTKCFKIGAGRCFQTSAIRLFVESGRIVVNPNCDHEVVYSRPKQLEFVCREGRLPGLVRHASFLARGAWRAEEARSVRRCSDRVGAAVKQLLVRRELLSADNGPGFPLIVIPARDPFDFPAVLLKRASDVRLTGAILCGAIEQGGPGYEAKDALFAVEHRKRDPFEKLELCVARWVCSKGHSEISDRQSHDFDGFGRSSQGVGL